MVEAIRHAQETEEFQERVIRIDRTRKTVKGGRISSSRVVAAVGDGRGSVGLGMGRALSATDGITKAMGNARKNMIRIPLDGYTIPHEVQAKVGGAVILLKPASRGTGIIAGGAVRQIIEVSGIRDILTKSLGSGNVMNRAKACFLALQLLRDPAEVAQDRGKSVEKLMGRSVSDPYTEGAQAAAAEEEAAEETPAAAEEKTTERGNDRGGRGRRQR